MYTLDKITDIMTQLASLMLQTSLAPENAKLSAVRRKYEDKKLCKIARLSELTGEVMQKMSRGEF